jgi:hypothetical protein
VAQSTGESNSSMSSSLNDESCFDEDSWYSEDDASDDDSSVSTFMIFAFCLCQLNAVLTS